MDIQKEREAFERLPLAELAIKCEYVYYNEKTNSYWPNEDFCPSDAPETMNFAWEAWQAAIARMEVRINTLDEILLNQGEALAQAKAQAIPEGFVLMPTTPSCEMWSGIARDLGRYMQMHDRYCPKSLKKYFDRFIGEIPEWLNKEVKDWDSDHAFATADLPAFIYMSMLEAQEPTND